MTQMPRLHPADKAGIAHEAQGVKGVVAVEPCFWSWNSSEFAGVWGVSGEELTVVVAGAAAPKPVWAIAPRSGKVKFDVGPIHRERGVGRDRASDAVLPGHGSCASGPLIELELGPFEGAVVPRIDDDPTTRHRHRHRHSIEQTPAMHKASGRRVGDSMDTGR